MGRSQVRQSPRHLPLCPEAMQSSVGCLSVPWPTLSLHQTKALQVGPGALRLYSELGFNRPWLLWLMGRMGKGVGTDSQSRTAKHLEKQRPMSSFFTLLSEGVPSREWGRGSM